MPEKASLDSCSQEEKLLPRSDSFDEQHTLLGPASEKLQANLVDSEQQTLLPKTLEQFKEAANASSSSSPLNHSPISPTGFPQIPGYRLLKELGKGGMGVVYQA